MKLSPITTPQKPAEFAVCDIEGMNWTKFIVLGHTNDGKDYYEFRSLDKYLDWLSSGMSPTTIVAHFGGKYDFLFLIRALLRRSDCKIRQIIPRGAGILYFDVAIGRHDYTFRDSSALLPFSLKSITENFGTETKKKEWDHAKTKGYSKALSSYLRDDCISLHQSMQKLFQWPLIQKAGPAWTMASQAMRVFRTYTSEPLYSLGDSYSAFCRKSYLGGRTEIFKPYHGGGSLYEYDVNSLYPAIMASNEFPVAGPQWVRRFETNRLGIYRAKVTSPTSLHVPVLGIVREGKYIFPLGTFEGHWTSAEINYAKLYGYKFEIMDGVVFGESRTLFKDFIHDLYEIRLTSPKNSVSDILAKLLMNSSYGRYGMNLDKENISIDHKAGSQEFRLLKIGKKNVQFYKEPVRLDSFQNVAIASFVTSYARIHMHRLLHAAGDSLYYTDTDSLFTRTMLPTSPDLGGLKLENTWDSAVFLLPKTYVATSQTKTKRAMKGFSSRKIQDFDLFDFQTALEGDLRKFKIVNEPKFATLKTALAQKKIVTMTKASTKQLRSTYNKRIIYKINGELRTKPIILGE